MDKRIKKTQNAIFSAVVNLLTTKDINKITVLELCEEAGINKSTFYLHFKNMNECLAFCLNTVMNGVVAFASQIHYSDVKLNPEICIEPLLDEVEQKLEYLIRFRNSNFYPRAINILKKKVIDAIIENNNFNYEDNYKEITEICCAVAGAIEATVIPLPIYNRKVLLNTITNAIK